MLTIIGHFMFPDRPEWSPMETARRRILCCMLWVAAGACWFELANSTIQAALGSLEGTATQWVETATTSAMGVLFTCVAIIAPRARSMYIYTLVTHVGPLVAMGAIFAVTGFSTGAVASLALVIVSTVLLLGPRHGMVATTVAIAMVVWTYMTFYAPGAVPPAPIEGRFAKVSIITCLISLVTGAVYFIELKRAVAQIERQGERALAASRAKTEFLANMSHEIRTPLNGVLGMAEALREDPLPPQAAKKVDVILESGQTLLAVVNDVLDLSKIEAGKMNITPRAGDVLDRLEKLVRLWRLAADEKGVTLSLTAEPDVPRYLVFDELRVGQCVSNLVSNAVKFTQAGSITVHVCLVPGSGNQVMITVKDTGIGMTKAQCEKLFVAFQQADASTTRRFGGTGLGLTITRRLAQLMGGTLTATSQPGEGSTFTLTFDAQPAEHPARDQTELDEHAPAPLETSLHGKRCLLVDDNAINRMVVRSVLSKFAMEFVEAENGSIALECLDSHGPFDFVLLDGHMPKMDGPQTFKHIRESGQPWCDVPVIALTADAMEGDHKRYLDMGMDGYVAKPIVADELIEQIIGACRARQLTPSRSQA